MFESVAPETFVPRSRKIFYESLPASIAVHVAVAALLVVAGTWNVTFPNESPHMTTMYTLALPPSLPPPPPAAAAAPKPVATPKPEQQVVVKKEEIVAPTIIPDEIPVVLPPQETKPVIDLVPVAIDVSGIVGGIEGGVGSGGNGSGDGAPGGMAGGMPGGVEGGIPPDTVVIKRHQPLPMSMTPVSMVYPFYPEEARQRGWEDAVTVRYVIGKDGRVKTVTVLEAPQRPVFEKTVVKAISHWRFRPLVKNGVKHEVIHELVVNFRLTGGSWRSDS
ncbi:MAG TPA: TonB family protein [Thermoanaerobaculia bacterium]|nr:TonB family protein [Thermoanaerobaculia bacterium]